jgi:hypothetical protein
MTKKEDIETSDRPKPEFEPKPKYRPKFRFSLSRNRNRKTEHTETETEMHTETEISAETETENFRSLIETQGFSKMSFWYCSASPLLLLSQHIADLQRNHLLQ